MMYLLSKKRGRDLSTSSGNALQYIAVPYLNTSFRESIGMEGKGESAHKTMSVVIMKFKVQAQLFLKDYS